MIMGKKRIEGNRTKAENKKKKKIRVEFPTSRDCIVEGCRRHGSADRCKCRRNHVHRYGMKSLSAFSMFRCSVSPQKSASCPMVAGDVKWGRPLSGAFCGYSSNPPPRTVGPIRAHTFDTTSRCELACPGLPMRSLHCDKNGWKCPRGAIHSGREIEPLMRTDSHSPCPSHTGYPSYPRSCV